MLIDSEQTRAMPLASALATPARFLNNKQRSIKTYTYKKPRNTSQTTPALSRNGASLCIRISRLIASPAINHPNSNTDQVGAQAYAALRFCWKITPAHCFLAAACFHRGEHEPHGRRADKLPSAFSQRPRPSAEAPPRNAAHALPTSGWSGLVQNQNKQCADDFTRPNEWI